MSAYYPTHHPEQRPDEIYLGNTDANGFSRSGWVSKRLGNHVQYPHGYRLGEPRGEGYYPWFIARSEVEMAIKTIRPTDPNSAERIATFQKMLDLGTALW